MKYSDAGEGSRRRRPDSGSPKRDKGQGGASKVNVASAPPRSPATVDPGSTPVPNTFSGYRDATSVPPIITQFSLPHMMAQVTPQPLSNEPGMQSMAAVLMALQMVGISPTQQNSRPVIWVPVDVPEPRTTHVPPRVGAAHHGKKRAPSSVVCSGRARRIVFAGSLGQTRLVDLRAPFGKHHATFLICADAELRPNESATLIFALVPHAKRNSSSAPRKILDGPALSTAGQEENGW
ncbi:hypothetical protein HPB50_014629 [Hyalomma asiaticum]|uniref:Uncharacterized protein n=1 Tax=Hyalomma asiaticum TaxID=266040 RepID=A0ACB7RUT5_HYAAI|nr:hypothetical protein HPB50_014629 [Hyalomma asiaticum]